MLWITYPDDVQYGLKTHYSASSGLLRQNILSDRERKVTKERD